MWKQAEILWRVIWRPLAVAGASGEPPTSIFTVGMDVPAGTSASGLAEFNRFYTDIHVPEVMGWLDFSRGVRFERYRAFRFPACPQFCAMYEADATATRDRRSRQRPSFSSGPPAWERHQTHWRLWYRRLSV